MFTLLKNNRKLLYFILLFLVNKKNNYLEIHHLNQIDMSNKKKIQISFIFPWESSSLVN